MFRAFVSVFVTFAALIGASAEALAESRFALVIGNSRYQVVSALPNPARDAKGVSQLLQEAGFEVTSAFDLTQSQMSGAVRDFATRLSAKSEDTIALVYYAGHGVQIDGENYLVPVDADINRESDVALEGIRFADVMNILDTVRSKTRIVILDACRNNPFADIAKATGRGLAIVNAPSGSLVAYSTSPGTTADDGAGANSPFTAALIKAAKQPGAPIELALKDVRLAVHAATAGQQVPWEVSSLTKPFSFFPGQGDVKQEPMREKSPDDWRNELKALSPQQAFELVLREDNVVVYQQYLVLYAAEPLAGRIRGILDRRLEMMAWFEAVTLNTAAAFTAFLKRYPNSDLAETARRMELRARMRSAMTSTLPGALGIAGSSPPETRTVVREVIKEVRVPEIQTVIKEVRVPSPPEIKTVIKEVPVVKTVVKEVPVVKTVQVPVVKTVQVPTPCRCSGPGPRGPVPTIAPQRNFRNFGSGVRLR